MNVSTFDIKVNKVQSSRLNQLDENNIEFGKLYADHMLVVDYEDGEWKQPEIMPYGNLSISPATSFFHYDRLCFNVTL